MNTNIKYLLSIIVLAIVGFVFYWYQVREVESSEVINESSPITKVLKDGEYIADTDYMTPAGKESIGVKMTLTGGQITSLNVEKRGKDKTSDKFQTRFTSGIESVALYQSIETLSVGVVSGASLTSGAFNQALANVRAQALR